MRSHKEGDRSEAAGLLADSAVLGCRLRDRQAHLVAVRLAVRLEECAVVPPVHVPVRALSVDRPVARLADLARSQARNRGGARHLRLGAADPSVDRATTTTVVTIITTVT